MNYIVNREGRIIGRSEVLIDAAYLESLGQRIMSAKELAPDVLHAFNIALNPLEAEARPLAAPHIELKTSAPDEDNDGVFELPADGRSKAKVALRVKDAKGKLVAEQVTIRIRTTAGTLSTRGVVTDDGKASFELISSRETVVANIVASAQGFAAGNIAIEFVPVQSVTKPSTGKRR